MPQARASTVFPFLAHAIRASVNRPRCEEVAHGLPQHGPRAQFLAVPINHGDIYGNFGWRAVLAGHGPYARMYCRYTRLRADAWSLLACWT